MSSQLWCYCFKGYCEGYHFFKCDNGNGNCNKYNDISNVKSSNREDDDEDIIDNDDNDDKDDDDGDNDDDGGDNNNNETNDKTITAIILILIMISSLCITGFIIFLHFSTSQSPYSISNFASTRSQGPPI